MVLFISDKIDYKSKTIIKGKKTTYTDKSVNSSRIYSNSKNMCNKNRDPKIYEAKFDRIERSNVSKIIVGDFNTSL